MTPDWATAWLLLIVAVGPNQPIRTERVAVYLEEQQCMIAKHYLGLPVERVVCLPIIYDVLKETAR